MHTRARIISLQLCAAYLLGEAPVLCPDGHAQGGEPILVRLIHPAPILSVLGAGGQHGAQQQRRRLGLQSQEGRGPVCENRQIVKTRQRDESRASDLPRKCPDRFGELQQL